MMGPDDKPDKSDSKPGIDHSKITKDRLAAECGNDVTDDAEARQNHDVQLGVTEKPEQMLIQHRISATFHREKRCSEITIGEKHGNGASEYRQRQQQQESRHEDR